jgi:hypothetical protein
MGLDDFATEDSIEEVFSSEEEDLFEISGTDEPEGPSSALPSASNSGATSAELMQVEPVPVEPQESLSIPSESEYPPHDAELDADLFDFDELFADSESDAGDEYLSKVEMLAEREAAEAALEKEEDAVQDVKHDRAVSTPARANAGSTQTVSVVGAPMFSVRVGRLILAAFLIVNAAFVFFAWSASQSFQKAVQQARVEIARNRHETAANRQPVPVSEPDVKNPRLYPPDPGRVDEWIASLDSPAEITFRIARREIEEGEYAAARRRLNILLAGRDTNGLSTALAADAEYLIAEAWMNEAKSVSARGSKR